MFRIGEFAKLSGLSIDTLYHYEKMRILLPGEVDPYTGYRRYDASQLAAVYKILALKDAGFSLEEIAHTLDNHTPTSSLLKLLEEKAFLLEEELSREKNRIDRLRTNIFLIKNGGIPIMNEITVKRVEPILAASVRRSFAKSRFDDELGSMWQEVNKYIDEKGGKRTIPCMMLYHRGWYDLEKWTAAEESEPLDVEVVEPVTENFEGSETVKVYELPAADQMACVVHKGPFSTIGKTNGALYEWIRQNGYQAAGPVREIYHKGDWVTEDPEEYITELQIPIMK